MEKRTKVFRSLTLEYFPTELLIDLEELTRQHDIDNNGKGKEIVRLLKQYNVPFEPLGSGTNRYAVIIDGYAFKIALDKLGKTDNKREMKYSRAMYPTVVKVYDCLPSGLVASFEYLTVFSLQDFYDNQNQMRELLSEISDNFLIGDIGVTTENYANWGTRNDGSIAILDFAYIYSLSYQGFKCTCEDEGTLQFDKDYVNLICPICNKKFSFLDIRRRISHADEDAEIGDIRNDGYLVHGPSEELEIKEEFSPFEFEHKKKKKKNVDDIPITDASEIYHTDKESQEEGLRMLDELLKNNF